MPDLLERISDDLMVRRRSERNSIDWYIQNYVIPAATQFQFGGAGYQVTGLGGLQTSLPMGRVREIVTSMPAYLGLMRLSPPAFAAEMVRASVLSQMRFTFRNTMEARIPRRTFGSTALRQLERPWTNGTTGELVMRMEWHAGVAGNAYVARQPKRLRVLRPDWVGIIYGSQREPDDPGHAIDGEVLGYAYQNGGFMSSNKPVTLLPEDVAHWSPLPDPLSPGLGMSWVTPALRDMQGDRATTEHKLNFFSNGATPNLVVKGIVASDPDHFDRIVDELESKHKGLGNAYKTIYLTGGADATVIGANLQQADFKAIQGAGETRIAMLSRVPASILQISEGLQGSALNAGNFAAARRTLADTWVYPSMQDLCHALAPLVDTPADAELWYDALDIPLLREDAKDAADIAQVEATTIATLVKEGFIPTTVIAAVKAKDMSILKHSGLVSVQLQPPSMEVPGFAKPPKPDPALPAPAAETTPVVPTKPTTNGAPKPAAKASKRKEA